MESYAFSNLWLLVTSAYEGVRPKTSRVELPLADREGRWFGSGIDGVFEHRIPIQQNARFDKAGTYHFSFAQDMRVNPLAGIMSVGLRVEKIPAR
jgi:gliding motility-associated lipoprotein GldH